MWMTWRHAMRSALYGPGGFYASAEPPARHFRTSVHVTPRYGAAFLRLLREVDTALGHPARLDLADVGAGRGELLCQVLAATEPSLAGRIAVHAVEVCARPAGLDRRIRWLSRLPPTITGLVIANEWLDNIEVDIAEACFRGPRLLLVDPATGAERPGPAPSPADRAWLNAWWPLAEPGERAEIGRSRCTAWAQVIGRIVRGVAVAVDYGHSKGARPSDGTLTGYLAGRAVPPVPDGSRDLTAHVALDACAHAGRWAGAQSTLLTTQRLALQALGITGQRPPLTLAHRDPRAYLRELSQASEEAELLDAGGLGGHRWLVQAAGAPLPASLKPLGTAAPHE
jgi:SAM-dependent MidA family methyltransferase